MDQLKLQTRKPEAGIEFCDEDNTQQIHPFRDLCRDQFLRPGVREASAVDRGTEP